MKQLVIENPVINLPFAEPQRHFRLPDEGIDPLDAQNFIQAFMDSRA